MSGTFDARGAALLGLSIVALSACGDMSSQPKQTAYAPLASPTVPPAGTVEFDAQPAPVPELTMELLRRGQSGYRVFCAPCHDESGNGHGMIVQRGFPAPPSLHEQRLLDAPTQHLVEVISQGYGSMYSFAQRIPDDADRWAIAAYIRALQRSDLGRAADVDMARRRELP